MELTAGENDEGRRLDRVLRKALPSCPLSLLHRLFRQGRVLVNGKPAEARYQLHYGEIITIPLENGRGPLPCPPPIKNSSKKGSGGRPSAMEILFQGRGLIAVNKPSGLEVHGPESLEAMVGSFLAGALPPSLSFKPGPLHRIDKPSSGIVVFSTSLEGARFFSSLLRERKVRKTYLALVEGFLPKEEAWDDGLVRDHDKRKTFTAASPEALSKPKRALTFIKPLAADARHSLVMTEISTGRTHQIRAQAAARGHPLAGDAKYGSFERGGFFLHAWKLEFNGILIEAPIPPAFKKRIFSLFPEAPERILTTNGAFSPFTNEIE